MKNVHDYYSPIEWEKIMGMALSQKTPNLVIHLGLIEREYKKLKQYFDYAKIYYAIKANPHPEIIQRLCFFDPEGFHVDIASVYELRKVLSCGITPDKMSCGNTIKKISDIKEFYEAGVRLYVTDSEDDLKQLASYAPGSKIVVRLLVNEVAATAEWPLSKKFGCEIQEAKKLLVLAKHLGLLPVGVSFHVGSQQKNINAWGVALEKAKNVFSELETQYGIMLTVINIGGGLPAHYMADISSTAEYAHAITREFETNFGADFRKKIKVIMEPGRSLVGNAGVITSEVILITTREKQRWVYVDVGRFGGLAETEGESVKYPLYSPVSGESSPCIIAGPTCDGADILYQKYQPLLPHALRRGDRLFFLSAGAYTATYSSVEFNGFPPLSNHLFFVR